MHGFPFKHIATKVRTVFAFVVRIQRMIWGINHAIHCKWLDRFVFHESGKGVVEFEHMQIGVDWQLVQTRSGNLFVLVRGNGTTELGQPDLQIMPFVGESPKKLLAHDDRWSTRVTLRDWVRSAHPKATGEGWLTISADHAERARKDAVATTHRFALTNLVLSEVFDVDQQCAGTRLSWRSIDDYENATAELRTLHRHAITATLTIAEADQAQASAIADIACELASYSRGCRVSWAYVEGLDAEGSVVSLFIGNPISGPYVPLVLIGAEAMWPFIEQTWQPYARFRSENRASARRLLGLLTNATTDDDFTELRGAKLGMTIDAVVTIVTGNKIDALPFQSNAARREFVERFRVFVATELPPLLKGDLTNGAKDALARTIGAKAGDILRPTFRNAIKQVCQAIGINVSDTEIKQFVHSRNQLIHEARFVCQMDAPPKDWPFETIAEEYFWMLRFLDRIVLRFIGYRGAFFDRFLRDHSEVPVEPE